MVIRRNEFWYKVKVEFYLLVQVDKDLRFEVSEVFYEQATFRQGDCFWLVCGLVKGT